eukprot:409016-Amphidinium_carterae.1
MEGLMKAGRMKSWLHMLEEGGHHHIWPAGTSLLWPCSQVIPVLRVSQASWFGQLLIECCLRNAQTKKAHKDQHENCRAMHVWKQAAASKVLPLEPECCAVQMKTDNLSLFMSANDDENGDGD